MAKASDVIPKHALKAHNGTMNSLQSSLTGDESLLNPDAAKSGSVATHSAFQEKAENESTSRVESSPEEYEDNWETDPDNPRNWPKSKKWIAVTIVSLPRIHPTFVHLTPQ